MAQPAPVPTASPSPAPSFSSQQRADLEQFVEEQIEKSGAVRDLVQSEMSDTFGLTLDLLNLLVTVLIAIPVITGLIALVLRRSVITQMAVATKRQLQEETGQEVKTQLEIQVTAELRHQVEAFKQELETLKSDYVLQLQNLQELFLNLQEEKQQIFQELARLTPSPTQQEVVGPDVQRKIQELTRQLEVLKSANPHLFLTAEDYFKEGEAFFFERRYEDALAAYDKALELRPDDAETWINRAIALRNLQRYEEAMASHDRALQLNPDYNRVWYSRGYTLRKCGRYDEAIAAYDELLQRAPDSPDVYKTWDSRGDALREAKRYHEAITAYDVALRLRPDHSKSWYRQACCHAFLGQLELTLQSLQRAIELSPRWQQQAKEDPAFAEIRASDSFAALIQARRPQI